MDLLLNILEKILFMAVSYFLLIFLSFSFFTGNFPPKKDDFGRAYTLMKNVISSKQDLQNASLQMQATATPSLEQVVAYQKLALRQTEATLEMTQLFKRFQGFSGPGNSQVATKLMKAQENLVASEKLLNEVTVDIQQGFKQ